MIAIRLAFSSLHRRPTGFLASFVALFSGATILMTFASLLDTRAAAGPETAKTLLIMASVVGGWGLVIVLFATLSTLSLLIRQRAAEMALLKSAGATPSQIGRMVVGEAAAVAVVAAATAVVPSVFAGRWLVALLGDTGRVPAGLEARFGPIAVAMGTGITLLAALAAATVAARRVTRRGAVEAIREAGVDTRRTSRLRVAGAAVVLASGLGCGVVTMTVFTGTEPALMAIGGQGAILAAIGLALLSPVLLGPIAAALAAPLRRAGVSGHLTVAHLRVRSRQMAGVLVPIILFTGIATGTLYMQAIENAAVTAPAGIAGSIETLNYVVVGMIALFAAVMLVNTVVAAIIGRRREFGQQRLIGSTPSQVLRLVGTEGTVLVVVGVLFGSLAAAVTVIPYSVARTGGPVPDATIGVYLAIVAVAVALTLGSHLGAAVKAMRTPAIQAGTRG
ncbi:FtsX-like permease family protein [Amycolatopsis roodepoortensis]|uniref:ABC transport system permease protein n=1 Tax=Amycolatopsis roodepoortensis TaxID=700274 RepID=A0ABR9L8X8_9PSEU|nr:FtsX-like permease family protein [Amycolatopsis roodepoortensis]MBE1577139.1 putative ABC transport system permease protein [Amycolatopsis roodepoortensis]